MGYCCRNLRYRVLLVLTGLVAVYLLIVFAIGSLTIMPSFVALDRAEAMTNLRRCADGIGHESQYLATLCADWGAWDDTWRFVLDANPEYARANLIPETVETCSKMNLLYIINANGHVVARIEQCGALGGPLHLSELPGDDWPLDHPLLRHATPESDSHGLLMTRYGPFLMASHPIVTSRKEGPVRGTVVAGRFMSPELLDTMRSGLHLEFVLRGLGQGGLSREDSEAVAALSRGSEAILRQVDNDRQRGYILLKDLFDRPVLLLKAELDRGVVVQGKRSLRYAQASNIGAAVLLLAGVYWLMRRLVLKRVDDMACVVARIEASGDRSLRVPVQGSDELTALAGRVNRMLAQVEVSEYTLRESRRAAEDASRVKSRFLSTVSHEIRSPINGIMGFCDAIQHGSDLDSARQHAQVILRESGMLLRLVNDLLDLSRLEAGKLAIEQVPVDLHGLLGELGQAAVVQAGNKGLEFDVVYGSDVPRWIWGDPLRVRQILQNLTANAIKFTEKGRVWLTAEVVREEAGERLAVSVHDTGIGIVQDRLGEIFEAFAQADTSTARKYGGTGLGLAIVRQLASLMGGRVQVTSEPGQGSVFTFRMPLKRAPEPSSESMANAPAGQSPNRQAVSARVLLADDYPAGREAARLVLEDAGHQVAVACSGQEAIELCERRCFDLIILDVQMPTMDGLEAVARIRAGGSANAGDPVLALTADDESRDACLRAGFSEVIAKPVRRATLLAAVARWCGSADVCSEENAGHQPAGPDNATVDALPPIDRAVAEHEFGGAERFQTVLAAFMASAAAQVEELRSALARGERASLRSIAHALKGGAATLEAASLADAAARLNAAAADADIEELRRDVEEIDMQLLRIVKYLEGSPMSSGGCEHAKSGR